jgi:hypothetical protein
MGAHVAHPTGILHLLWGGLLARPESTILFCIIRTHLIKVRVIINYYLHFITSGE